MDTEEISLSVSSTVLLGELLHLANLLLPREVSLIFLPYKFLWIQLGVDSCSKISSRKIFFWFDLH